MSRKLNPLEVRETRELRAEDLSCRQIEDRSGISKSSVQRFTTVPVPDRLIQLAQEMGAELQLVDDDDTCSSGTAFTVATSSERRLVRETPDLSCRLPGEAIRRVGEILGVIDDDGAFRDPDPFHKLLVKLLGCLALFNPRRERSQLRGWEGTDRQLLILSLVEQFEDLKEDLELEPFDDELAQVVVILLDARGIPCPSFKRLVPLIREIRLRLQHTRRARMPRAARAPHPSTEPTSVSAIAEEDG